MPPPSNTVPAIPASPPPAAVGTVVFVGAGPGDPELLTLRAAECLRQADVIVNTDLRSVKIVAQQVIHQFEFARKAPR